MQWTIRIKRYWLKVAPEIINVPEVQENPGIPGGYTKQKLLDYHNLQKLFFKKCHQITQALVWNSQEEEEEEQQQHEALLDLGVSLQANRD